MLAASGAMLLAGTALVLLVDAAGWLPAELVRPLATWGWRLSLAAIGGGLLLQGLGRIGRALVRHRCVRCGRAVERGQTYCTEHLRAAVNEARDAMRGKMLRFGRPRR